MIKQQSTFMKKLMSIKDLHVLENEKTHIFRHTEISNTEMLERTFHDVSCNSRFHKGMDVNDLIVTALASNAYYIEKWKDDPDESRIMPFYYRRPSDENFTSIGAGPMYAKDSGLIKHFATDTLCIVLQKDKYAPLGITLITAYPDLNAPSAWPTNIDLSNAIYKTNTYRKAKPLERTYLAYRTNPKANYAIFHQKENKAKTESLFLIVPAKESGLTHRFHITEQQTTMQTVRYNECTGKTTPVNTKYSKMTNSHEPYIVPYQQQKIISAFYKDYPDASKAIGYIQKHLQNEKTKQIHQKQNIHTYLEKTENEINASINDQIEP